jgi:hypothetical protein
MIRLAKTMSICAALLALAGCAYPTSTVEQGAERGHLRFTDAPVGAQVRVDGQARGARTGADVLVVDVEPGKHLIEETSDGRILVHADFEVGAGSTVEVRSAQ